MRSTLAFAVALLALGANQGFDRGQTEERNSGQDSHQYGPFNIVTDFNETLYKDKLKISKANIVFDLQVFGSTIQKLRLKRKEFLSLCENTTLVKQDAWQNIDCKPLAEQLSDRWDATASSSSTDDAQATSSQSGYVKQTIYNLKLTDLHLLNALSQSRDAHSRQHYSLYPLKPSVTKSKIAARVQRLGLEKSGFATAAEEIGFYIEFNPAVEKTDESLLCSGYILATMNETVDYILYSSEPYPGFFLTSDNFINVAIDKGALFSIEDMKCGSAFTDKTLHLEFAILRRMEFPYISVDHRMWIEPVDSQFLNYTGTIQQEPTQTEIEGSYDTSIKIISKSVIKSFNIYLDQVFKNTDSLISQEFMFMMLPYYGSMKVNATWVGEILTKNFEFGWYPKGPESAQKEADPNMVSLHLLNKPDDFMAALVVNKTKIYEAIGLKIEDEISRRKKEVFEILESVVNVMRDEL